MSQDLYSQFLRFYVAESAAGTLTEGDPIMTGASVNRVGGQNIALEIHAVCVRVEWPQDLPATGALEYVKFALSTRSGLTDMPTLDEEHVIYMNCREIKAGVGTYLPLIFDGNAYMPAYYEFKYPLLISHNKIYPYIKSSNSSVAGACWGFILFTYVLLDADLAIEALEAFR